MTVRGEDVAFCDHMRGMILTVAARACTLIMGFR